jgi:uncharacterized membrane protein
MANGTSAQVSKTCLLFFNATYIGVCHWSLQNEVELFLVKAVSILIVGTENNIEMIIPGITGSYTLVTIFVY